MSQTASMPARIELAAIQAEKQKKTNREIQVIEPKKHNIRDKIRVEAKTQPIGLVYRAKESPHISQQVA